MTSVYDSSSYVTVYAPQGWPDFQDDPRRPALLGWLKDNGIDPRDIPLDAVIATDNSVIHYVAMQRTAETGTVQVNNAPVLEARSTRLKAPVPTELMDRPQG